MQARVLCMVLAWFLFARNHAGSCLLLFWDALFGSFWAADVLRRRWKATVYKKRHARPKEEKKKKSPPTHNFNNVSCSHPSRLEPLNLVS
jgi:hypothetical protein